MVTRVLYITWDGPQVSYLEGLFLPVFTRLRAHDIEIQVLQFLWGDDKHLERQERVCAEQGIYYQKIVVPRVARGLGAFLTAAIGCRVVLRLAREHGIDILMPRSFMPAITALHTIWLHPRQRLPLVYDVDGLGIDEKVDSGSLSCNSLTYRLLKWYEKAAITAATSVIGRTAAACQIYQGYDGHPEPGKYVVAVNGRDPQHFEPSTCIQRKAARRALGIDPACPVVVYSGSFGEKYCPSRMFRLFRAILEQRPDAKFLIMTGSPEAATNYVEQCQSDILGSVRIKTFSLQEVPLNLATADLGLCICQDTFSNQAVQATKLGEYLLCGLAVAGTPNVLPFGLLESVATHSVGAMSDDEIDMAASWFVENVLAQRDTIRDEARRLGTAHLTVDKTVSSYAMAIQRAVEAS